MQYKLGHHSFKISTQWILLLGTVSTMFLDPVSISTSQINKLAITNNKIEAKTLVAVAIYEKWY